MFIGAQFIHSPIKMGKQDKKRKNTPIPIVAKESKISVRDSPPKKARVSNPASSGLKKETVAGSEKRESIDSIKLRRDEARRLKQWDLADELRLELQKRGIKVQDQKLSDGASSVIIDTAKELAKKERKVKEMIVSLLYFHI